MPYRANSSHPCPFPKYQHFLLFSNPPQAARFFPPPSPPTVSSSVPLSSLLLAALDLVEASFLIEFRGFKNLAGPSSSLYFFLHSFTLPKLLLPHMPYAPSQRLVRIFSVRVLDLSVLFEVDRAPSQKPKSSPFFLPPSQPVLNTLPFPLPPSLPLPSPPPSLYITHLKIKKPLTRSQGPRWS